MSFDSPLDRLRPTPLTDGLRRSAAAWLAVPEAERTPVPPRAAATVILVREAADGPEVFVHQRPASMAFAAGAIVFPGGRVEPHDADCVDVWSGPVPAEFATRMGFATDPPTSADARAAALVGAAVRETFEEASVLLATGTGSGTDPDLITEADRVAVEAGRLTLTQLLTARGLRLRADLLGLWAHWVTPEFEPRRYDTWFFVAAMPSGQRADARTTEAESAMWVRPGDAVAAVEDGTGPMLPPTYESCAELAAFFDSGRSVADLIEQTRIRDLPRREPRLIQRDGEIYLEVG